MSEASAAPGGGVTPEEQFHTGASIKVATVAALGGFLFGYDSAVINGAVDAPSVTTFNVEPRPSASRSPRPCSVPPPAPVRRAASPTAFGRLRVMQIAAVLFLISAIGAGSLAERLAMLIVFRIIGGLGVGIASVIAPAYIAEIAPASLRGRLGSLQQLAIVTGIFISLLVDYVFATVAGGSTESRGWGCQAWRWMFLAMAIPAIVYGVLSLTHPRVAALPHRHLRIPEAARGPDHDARAAGLEVRIERIQRLAPAEHKPSFKDLQSARGRPAADRLDRHPAVGLPAVRRDQRDLLLLERPLGGRRFQRDRLVHDHRHHARSSTSSPRSSRSPRSTGSAASRCCSSARSAWRSRSASMAVVFGIATGRRRRSAGRRCSGAPGPIALIAANLFVVAFGMSWGPVVWVLLGEMFPNKIRAAALSVAAGPVGRELADHGQLPEDEGHLARLRLRLLRGVCAAVPVLRHQVGAETKGKELEDMDDDMMIAPH